METKKRRTRQTKLDKWDLPIVDLPERACMECGRTFKPVGKWNRRCKSCPVKDVGILAQTQGRRR